MALGDQFLFDVARAAVLSSLDDPRAIAYRQEILRDALELPAVVREMYHVAVEAIHAERKIYFGISSQSPDTILHRSVQVLEIFVMMLKRLRQIADSHARTFHSEGLVELFGILSAELDDEYFQTVEEQLRQLRFRHGALISAQLSKGAKGAHYVLRRPRRQSWRERIALGNRSSYSFQIADRDQSGFQALAELRGRGINLVANALAQSNDHILSFFTMLRAELGFYVGCLNLHGELAQKSEHICFPVPIALNEPTLSGRGLYDVCLSLIVSDRVVGNDVTAEGKALVVITGANQGGKSTFLRSVGLAYLMMQCGMFVPAESFRAGVSAGVFTHYKREEDATMTSGKLDEELRRMGDIAGKIRPGCILLCNESFASTNEREGSEIARQIVRALTEAGIKVLYVTHLFDLAHGLYREQVHAALFLRAERQADGRRTFRLVEGAPLATSYGEDLYRRIFGSALDAVPTAGSDRRP